jgi:hypothetical protein
MRHQARSLTWQGQAFRFERVRTAAPGGDSSFWAVSRRGEFIGTMPCSPEVTTKDFDVRGMHWLRELLGGSAGTTRST